MEEMARPNLEISCSQDDHENRLEHGKAEMARSDRRAQDSVGDGFEETEKKSPGSYQQWVGEHFKQHSLDRDEKSKTIVATGR